MKRLFFILCISVFAHADIFKYTSGGIASLALIDTTQHVTASAAGSNGEVWYGTRDGFVFRSVNGAVDSSSYRKFGNGQAITAIETSPNGDIWVGAEILYRYSGKSWSSYAPKEYVMWGTPGTMNWKTFVHYWINDIAVESDSVLWIASEGQGALRFTHSDGKFQMYGGRDENSVYNSMSLVACEPGQTPVFGGRFTYGYGLFSPDSEGYMQQFLGFDSLDYKVDNILGYYHDGSGRYWMVTTRGLYVAEGAYKNSKFIPKESIAATVMMAIISDVIKSGSTEINSVEANRSLTNVACKLDSRSLTLSVNDRVDVTVYDFRGRVCASMNDLSSGVTELSTQLSAGCYLIRIVQNGKLFSTTALIQ